MKWNDDKAEMVKDLVQRARPKWTVHHEFQACVSVHTEHQNSARFWFGGANDEVGGDVYESDKTMELGVTALSVGTGLHRDAHDPEDIAKAIVRQVVRVNQALTTVRQQGWLSIAGQGTTSGMKEWQLDLEMKLMEITDHLQDLEEIWAPITGIGYATATGHAARRLSETAARVAEGITVFIANHKFEEAETD